jgi:hypothetical protein
MNERQYIDLFTAKDRVIRQLSDSGAQSSSRLLLTTQLPESVLKTVLSLLENENKVSLAAKKENDENVYQPVSGSFLSGSFIRR